MDVFPRTFQSAAAAGGVSIPASKRHVPIFERCVEADDTAVLLTRCLRPNRPTAGEFLLLLTTRRLIVTHESRVLHRLRLHLNVHLRRLHNVTWTSDPDNPGLELAATAVDGVRERFRMDLGNFERVRQVESISQRVFAGIAAPSLHRAGAVAA